MIEKQDETQTNSRRYTESEVEALVSEAERGLAALYAVALCDAVDSTDENERPCRLPVATCRTPHLELAERSLMAMLVVLTSGTGPTDVFTHRERGRRAAAR